MTLHPLNVQMNDDRRAGQARGECGRHSSRHIDKDHVYQRVSLPLAGNWAARTVLFGGFAARFFFHFVNARNRLCWQALADLSRVRCHNQSLSCVPGFDACEPIERNIGNVRQIIGALQNV